MDKQRVKEILEITIGVILLAIGFYFFYLPTNLVTGGALGVSIIVGPYLPKSFPVSIFLLLLNIALLILGGLVLGREFFLKTVYATILLPIITFVLELTVPNNAVIVNQITEGKLLISAIFGGLLSGVGLGLAVKNNATTGGMDVVQRIVSKYLKIPFSIALYLVDGIIIFAGMILIKGSGLQNGFYAIGAMIATGIVIDHIVLSGKSGYTVFIVTDEYKIIKEAIYENLNRGVTKMRVVGGYSEKEKDMIICTLGKSQLYSLKHIVHTLDPNAFTFVTKTNEALGQGFQQGID